MLSATLGGLLTPIPPPLFPAPIPTSLRVSLPSGDMAGTGLGDLSDAELERSSSLFSWGEQSEGEEVGMGFGNRPQGCCRSWGWRGAD